MRAPVLVIGDGALGFWAAVGDVFSHIPATNETGSTRPQTSWISLPKSVHKRAKKAIHEITCAENKKEAAHAIEAFASEFGTKWPKAVAKITQEKELLLTFYEFPAEHWVHLRTTNPIESTFAPVRVRTDVTKGPGSRAAGVAMIFKLMEAAEGRWRRIPGAHLVPLVRTGAKFVNVRVG